MQAGRSRYNWATMLEHESATINTFETRTLRMRRGGVAGAVIAIAIVLSTSSAGLGHERGRSWSDDAGVADACWAAAPTVCADVTACPAVTSPEATVARFSILPLSMIATVVDVRVARDVLVARIGGLYGP
jgi:hypothetical protein